MESTIYLYLRFTLEVAKFFFPALSEDNFVDVFKLTLLQAANHLRSREIRLVRNFLMFVYWCKHYPTMKCLGALFGLKKTQTCDIIHRYLKIYSDSYASYVNVDSLDFSPGFFLADVVGIVDSTEVKITAWARESYSGKKRDFTLKYQVVVDINSTGENILRPVNICGPFLGKEADATIWKQCSFLQHCVDEGFYVLGDKGYVGCDRVYAMKKKRKGQVRLADDDKAYNKRIAQFRVRVENHFADVKKWKVVSHVYRGDVLNHHEIWFSCEFLTLLCKS